jgi:hypothetical protein
MTYELGFGHGSCPRRIQQRRVAPLEQPGVLAAVRIVADAVTESLAWRHP